MKTREFIEFLLENNVQRTIIPTLNLWLFYSLSCVILWAVYNFAVASLVFVIGPIFLALQEQKVKDRSRDWWNRLPLLKFHSVMVFVELGVLGVIVYLVKIAKLITLSVLLTNKEKR